MDQVSPLLRKILALTLLVAAVFVLFSGVVEPLADRVSLETASISQSKKLLGRYEQLEASRDLVRNELQALREAHSTSGIFIAAASTELAAAQLQQKIRTLVDNSGGQLRSMQMIRAETLPGREGLSETGGTVTPVAVKAVMIVDVSGLIDIFQALETGRPFLFLENVQLRAFDGRRNTRSRDRGLVQAHFEVTGLMSRNRQ